MDEHALILADSDGVIRMWSDGAERLFGHRAWEAMGQTLDLIVPEPMREARWAGFRRAMTAPQSKDLAADIPVLCADGDLKTLPGRLIVLTDGLGRAIGATGIFAPGGSTGLRPFG